jgi:hypothetical protein
MDRINRLEKINAKLTIEGEKKEIHNKDAIILFRIFQEFLSNTIKYADAKNFDVVLNYRVDRYLRGGDHIPFTRKGFTSVRFCEMNENYLHQHQDVRVENGAQYGDLPVYVNYAYAANITRVNLVSLASLANAPLPPEKPGIKLALGNVSTLEWETPSTGPAPKGYYILVRETYEANWSEKIYVTETSASIPYSKDNYFFAIQSVSEDGNTSLPVLPAPRRN